VSWCLKRQGSLDPSIRGTGSSSSESARRLRKGLTATAQPAEECGIKSPHLRKVLEDGMGRPILTQCSRELVLRCAVLLCVVGFFCLFVWLFFFFFFFWCVAPASPSWKESNCKDCAVQASREPLWR
jgi:hypothetical protein